MLDLMMKQGTILASLQLVSVVSVAQLVESRIVIPVVAGSSPVVHPTIEKPQFS